MKILFWEDQIIIWYDYFAILDKFQNDKYLSFLVLFINHRAMSWRSTKMHWLMRGNFIIIDTSHGPLLPHSGPLYFLQIRVNNGNKV